MLRRLIWSIFMVCCLSNIRAQKISEYIFESNSMIYQSIQMTGNTKPQQGSQGEGAWQNVPIGFSFIFENVNYTSISASTNGFLRLYNTVDFADDNMKFNNLSGNTVTGPVIAPLWDDLSNK